MHAKLKSIAAKALSLLGAGLLVCTGVASAQTFEWHYGAESCRENGRSVVPVREGGYISVGNQTCSDDCGANNIYVVRTHDNGLLHWSMLYDLGGNDIATSVKEVFYDPKGYGGFIITGFTDGEYSSCHPSVNAFLLRIDRCGNVLWVRTYGHEKTTETGHEVLETEVGTAGDFVVAGWTTYPSNNGERNGYIFRTDAGGNLIWDRVYDAGRDDYFYSLDEARHNNNGSEGDIIAAGGTTSYDYANQGWIVRVDGSSGKFNGGPHGAVALGGKGDEEFKSVRELDLAYPGEIVATGYSTSIADARDVYAVKTKPHPCEVIVQRVFGDYGKFPDEGMAIRETIHGGSYYDKGSIVITGYMHTTDAEGHGGEDAFLQILEPGSLKLLPECYSILYGGEGNDRGLSVEPLEDNYPCRSKGFVVSGFTQSPSIIGNDPQQLYLIKTDEDLNDNCKELKYKVHCEEPGWEWKCGEPKTTEIKVQCDSKYERKEVYWEKQRCFDPLKTEFCKLEPCKDCPQDQKGAKRFTGASSEKVSGSVVALSGFPNPVKKGNAVKLEYTLLKDATVTITVSDLSGRTVYNGNVSGRTGVSSTSVATQGWASGSYIVSVSVGGESTTTRVVVTE